MIKISIRGEIKEFDEKKIYFKKLKLVEPEFYTTITYSYYVGQNVFENDVFAPPLDYPIAENLVDSILLKYPNIPIYEEMEVFLG